VFFFFFDNLKFYFPKFVDWVAKLSIQNPTLIII